MDSITYRSETETPDPGLFARARASYSSRAGFSALSQRHASPGQGDGPQDGYEAAFTDARALAAFLRGPEFAWVCARLRRFARLLLTLEHCEVAQAHALAPELEQAGLSVIGFVAEPGRVLVIAERNGTKGEQERSDLVGGYYKMSRYKVYQQQQAALMRYDITGLVLECGDSNGVYRKMLDEDRTEYRSVPYPQYDLQDLHQFPDGCAGGFICDNTLEHVPDYARGLAEIHRVLAPGGVGIFMMPFIATCQPNDYFRFSAQAMPLVFRGFPEVHMGGWGNTSAAALYVLRNKWVTVAHEAGGELVCHDRQNPADGELRVPTANDPWHPIHYWVLARKEQAA
jgi:SAM-dependent methyltransferase